MAYDIGRYILTAEGQGFEELPSGNKTPYFFIEGTITHRIGEGDQRYELPSDEQYRRNVKLWMSDKAIKYTTESLRELGWEGTKWSNLDPSRPGFHSFAGAEIPVVCSHRMSDGKTYDQFELPFAGGDSEPTPSNPSVARNMDALFGKALTTGKAKPNGAQKNEPVNEKLQEAAATPDDDVPF